jgi:proline racemase
MRTVFENWDWPHPASWTRIRTTDMHTGGEPRRVFTSELPPIEGSTVLEKRRSFHNPLWIVAFGMACLFGTMASVLALG